jgi:hypothetical protein
VQWASAGFREGDRAHSDPLRGGKSAEAGLSAEHLKARKSLRTIAAAP